MVHEVERRARRLLRAADTCRVCQYLSLTAGAVCTRLIGPGAGVVVMFGQTAAAIVFGWVFSHQRAKLISIRYPELDPFRHLWRRRDRYTPLVRAAALEQGDYLIIQMLDWDFPFMIRTFVLVLIMAILDPIFSA